MNEEKEPSKLVQQVAHVIGYNNAVVELEKVRRGVRGNNYNEEEFLMDSFDWEDSPQGFNFWDAIDDGIPPDKYKGWEGV